MKFIRKIFQRKPKSYLAENFRIIPAFDLFGETYYMHDDPLNVCTGRGLSAMVHYEEILMRCDINYLNSHIAAMEKLLSDPKKIDISSIVKLNMFLKERTKFLAALPDQVFKLASVVFFTKDESPFSYNRVTNEKKIKRWQEGDDMYSFFLRTPLSVLLPFLELPENSSKIYLDVMEKINKVHLAEVRDLLSSQT